MPTGDDTRTATLKPRPTVYNGIHMRSRLEAGFAQWLDERAVEWEYEPECFANTDGQYLPDFLVRDVPFYLGGEHGIPTYDVYFDVKPPIRARLGWAVEFLQRMAIILDSRPDAIVCVVAPDDRSDQGVLVIGTDRVAGESPMLLQLMWKAGPGFALGIAVDPPPWLGEWWKGSATT